MKYVKGDLFKTAPIGSILAHSCNCYGSWGGGIALVFHQKFPAAYRKYHDHCVQFKTTESKREHLLGKCFLVSDIADTGEQFIIACLFTSLGYGSSVDSPASIVENTGRAMADLERQLRLSDNMSPVHMPRINSGLFRVPWELTEKELKRSNLDIRVHDL